MTDIIVIASSIFLDNRDHCDDGDDIEKKYEHIYGKYSCFTSHGYIPVGSTRHDGKHKHSTGKKSTFQHRETVKKPKELSKILLGILNVINKNNYNKILMKIRLLKTDHNVGMITKDILKISTLQGFYIDIYARLIYDFMSFCSGLERVIATECLTEFVSEFISSKEWITKKDLELNNYSVFCDVQKTKNQILAKNMLIIQLVKAKQIDISLEAYGDTLFADLKVVLDENDENSCSTLLNMLIYLVKADRKIGNRLDTGNLLDKTNSKKIAFIVEDLIIAQNGEA